MRWSVVTLILFCLCISTNADAQHRRSKSRRQKSENVTLDSTGAIVKTGKVQPIKADELTLRYKPQVGTLLYDVETQIIHDQEHGLSVFPYIVKAEMAIENKAIDINKSLWTFERFFKEIFSTTTHRRFYGRDTLRFREVGAINKRTRLTYSMSGEEVENIALAPLQLSGDGQFSIYFLKPPRLLIPLPKHKITYGIQWTDTTHDTVHVSDTVNYLTANAFYDVAHTYTFDRLTDTLGGTVAVISGTIDGAFSGDQIAFAEDQDPIYLKAPITGADTTYLNLSTGRVVLLKRQMHIPVTAGRKQDAKPISEVLDVKSIVQLNRSNIQTTAVDTRENIEVQDSTKAKR